MFLDQAKIFLASGTGGNGCVSFLREKFIEFGGPDGGHGGKGGNVLFRATKHINTLSFFRYQQHFKAPKGSNGMGKNMSGREGEDLIIKVPIGTQIWNESNEEMMFDLIKNDEELLFLGGGKGGAGNASQRSSTNRAPKTAKDGRPGEEMWVWLRLKLLADVGIIGLPNAGKSTLLSKLTNANPKIANYPFTTIHPQLGVVSMDDKEIVIADLPGLIEGAHEGKGLGHRFLGHIERCHTVLHLIDITVPDPIAAYKTVRNELMEYMPSLCDKHEIIAFSKCELADDDLLCKFRGFAEFYISSVTGMGMKDLVSSIASCYCLR